MACIPIAGVARILRAAALALPLLTPSAADATAGVWEWTRHGGRERITLQGDASLQDVSVSRVGAARLRLRMPTQTDMTLSSPSRGPAADALAAELTPAGAGFVELRLTTSAFGYMVTRPAPHVLCIDIYDDPLGARWRSSGQLAPAATTPPASRPRLPAIARKGVASPPLPQPAPPSPPDHHELEEDSVQDDPLLPLKAADDSLHVQREPHSRTTEEPPGLLERAFASRAYAASPESPPDVPEPSERTGARDAVLSPQEILVKVNTGGPEAWPSDRDLSTSLTPAGAPPQIPAASPAPLDGPAQDSPTVPVLPSAPASLPAPPAAESETVAPPKTDQSPELPTVVRESATPPKLEVSTPVGGNGSRPVIYVDEAGNIVPKPLEPEKMLEEAAVLLEGAQYAEALINLQKIKAIPSLNPALREKTLYFISDALNALHAGKPLEGFEDIVNATSEAMNANLRSPRVPDALFRLGMANLRVGNLSEAEGYFKALRRRYPDDANVPTGFVSLARAFFDKGLSRQAVDNFRMVTHEYPESAVLREASTGLLKALVMDKNWKEAQLIADFVEKRWPREYLSDLEVLEQQARINLGLGRLEDALQQLWLYYNIEPSRPGNDMILAAIGDLYLRTGRVKPALQVFSNILKRYPDSEGAEIALLRQAEKSIHDSPITIAEMDAVFADPGDPPPHAAYRELVKRRPEAPRSVLARLKLAFWMFWSKEYTDAMGAAADYIDAYPESPDVEQAREIIMRAFMAELRQSLAEENYGRILILWNGFPLVRERYGPITPELRNALARAYLERGDENSAMELYKEFLKTPKIPGNSDQAFALYFNRYLRDNNWNALLDLAEIVKDWDMDVATRGQLDYAMALSAENLGLAEKALPLWRKLSGSDDIQLYQRAYATYFLAKDAERRKDIKDAYIYNKEALELFGRLEQERSDKADPQRIKEITGDLMDIAEVANRIPEALDWLERYSAFVADDSPEYPGLRFREARLYRKLGDTAKAKALLELIMRKTPDAPFAKAAEAELRTFSVSRDLRNFMPPTP